MSPFTSDFSQPQQRPRRARVTVVGAGPAGMTSALLLAEAGHAVTLVEASDRIGGLWASRLDTDGYFRGDNSCKVFQASYHTAPAMFERLGTRWQDHFVPRFDLTTDWLRPFVRDCQPRDLVMLSAAFLKWRLGGGGHHEESVEQYLERRDISPGCRAWMRATALGGIAGTLRMTMWEFFHRLGANVGSVIWTERGPLYWNAQPPSCDNGFLNYWATALQASGVELKLGTRVDALDEDGVTLACGRLMADAVFVAVPPPALGAILAQSSPDIATGLGLFETSYLRRSRYEHLGITWFFDRPLPNGLPLGGHCVRDGWHPILVEHPQYRPYLRPPAITTVVSSVAVDTDFRHPRLGSLASAHEPTELAQILWADEQRADPTLPDPIDVEVYGLSSATQIVADGPLRLRHPSRPIFVATNLHGRAPYFTASLESAIQAGALAAAAYDPSVATLPMGDTGASPWHLQPPQVGQPEMSCAPSS
ncbi:MAG: FAD-dependent oxidoreductase [Myxococcales bacterium]|nr:FAD-dependent oxidoreductase [Myxococcales bacterium]